MAIGLFVAVRAIVLGREVLAVLGQEIPDGLQMDAVVADLEAIPGVENVHDQHVWTLTSGIHALSAHAVLQEGAAHAAVLGSLRTRVTTGFAISHVTVQLEERCCGEHMHA